MSRYAFKLPDLAEGMVEAEIVEWRVEVGDNVTAEQPLVDVMTDKATVEITSPVGGRVLSVGGAVGDMVPVGAELLVFEIDGTGVEPEERVRTPAAAAREVEAPAAQGRTDGDAQRVPVRLRASPAVRKRAREAGVDLREVRGSGPHGRIRGGDLEAHIAACVRARGTEQTTDATGVESIPLRGLRRRIAENVARSKRRIPHFVYTDEADLTELGALRELLNAETAETRPRLTWLPFFMRALARVLRDYPQCNAHFDEENAAVTRFAAVHVGIATQTEAGLMVPVVRDVQTLDLWQCAEITARVVEAARSGRAGSAELSGSTATITSLGKLAGISTSPVINHPEVMILSINRIERRPVCRDGSVVPRLMTTLSAAFDHRVVDGHDAASMTQALKGFLEHPAALFLDLPMAPSVASVRSKRSP